MMKVFASIFSLFILFSSLGFIPNQDNCAMQVDQEITAFDNDAPASCCEKESNSDESKEDSDCCENCHCICCHFSSFIAGQFVKKLDPLSTKVYRTNEAAMSYYYNYSMNIYHPPRS